MPPKVKRPALEVERVLQHYLEHGDIRYLVSWRYYPEKASTFADYLERDSKEVLFEYHKKIGVLDTMGNVIKDKLFATAKKEPVILDDCPATSIKSHYNDTNGVLMFRTRFKDGSLIDRPQNAFCDANEPAMIKAYLMKHGLDEATPKPRKAIKAKSLAAPSLHKRALLSTDENSGGEEQPRTRSRFNSTGVSEGSDTKPRSTRRQTIHDVVDEIGEASGTPKTSRGTRTPCPQVVQLSDSSDEDVKPGLSGVSRSRTDSPGTSTRGSRNVTVRELVKESGGASDTPNTSRVKSATGTKKAASPCLSATNKRTKIDDTKNNSQKKFHSLTKDDDGVLMMIFKDKNGQLSEKDVDSAHEEDPKTVLDALKKFANTHLPKL